MSEPKAYAVLDVSEEFLATSGALGRRLVREELRGALRSLGGELLNIRYRIDPFERHGDLEARPARPFTHVIKAVAELGSELGSEPSGTEPRGHPG